MGPMIVIRAAIAFAALAHVSSGVAAQVRDPLAPYRASNLPRWALEVLGPQFQAQYQWYDRVNPFYQRGDFDGDGQLDAAVFLAALLIFVGIPAITVITVARLRAKRPASLPADVTARLEVLERGVQDLQQELGETQERLDFAERLLSKAREERRIGS